MKLYYKCVVPCARGIKVVNGKLGAIRRDMLVLLVKRFKR